MLAVADQEFVACLPGQAPERQYAATGYVFAEGQPVGWHAKPASQVLTQLAGGLFHKRPYRAGKRTQLLDAPPGGRDGLKG